MIHHLYCECDIRHPASSIQHPTSLIPPSSTVIWLELQTPRKVLPAPASQPLFQVTFRIVCLVSGYSLDASGNELLTSQHLSPSALGYTVSALGYTVSPRNFLVTDLVAQSCIVQGCARPPALPLFSRLWFLKAPARAASQQPLAL
jgi:hypothetical protein